MRLGGAQSTYKELWINLQRTRDSSSPGNERGQTFKSTVVALVVGSATSKCAHTIRVKCMFCQYDVASAIAIVRFAFFLFVANIDRMRVPLTPFILWSHRFDMIFFSYLYRLTGIHTCSRKLRVNVCPKCNDLNMHCDFFFGLHHINRCQTVVDCLSH